MKCYLAPLEGITTYVYRRAVREYFGGGTDKYFTPFFSPNTKRHKSSRAIRDILPENNPGMYLVPQMLTNEAKDFLKFEKDMRARGYGELNINMGCPSGTVVSKARGAGFLRHPERIDEFLYEIFEHTDSRISVKTRIGMEDPEEFPRLLEVYNKYPLCELIVHARTGREMYMGKPHRDAFLYAAENAKMPLCCNGDIFTPEDVQGLPENADIMCGRGMIADPALIRKLKGGPGAEKKEIREFLRRIASDYRENDPDEKHLLFKLKEIWSYMKDLYPGYDREYKKLFKAGSFEEYDIEANKILK